jgi:hypothetical protein
MANEILMQRGTALWLAKHTSLSNKQIAEFCNLHEIEIDAFRSGLENNIVEFNPIDAFSLSEEMIKECEANEDKELISNQLDLKIKKVRKNRSYMKRHEIVNAIFWMINNHVNVPDLEISKLFNCTKKLVNSIREKNYKEYNNLVSRHPVVLELCNQETLDKLLLKYSN